MYAVIFEVEIREGQQDAYLSIAAKLKEQLITMPGFISIERFESLVNEGKLVSLSFWEDEESLIFWKKNIDHLGAQTKGRASIFKDYRIRIANVERDYTMESSTFAN
ncbi:MAG: heme-degrading monooxygenase HmoA [Sulfurimonas sp.]|jgi:heme-degrading monooxygenase HmoA|uniref:antibiotic biosynthesis monooxygenase family protein n=1 Tax=Sulfurimonas sp. TaxID=2022749 RepID=UPI0039E35D97